MVLPDSPGEGGEAEIDVSVRDDFINLNLQILRVGVDGGDDRGAVTSGDHTKQADEAIEEPNDSANVHPNFIAPVVLEEFVDVEESRDEADGGEDLMREEERLKVKTQPSGFLIERSTGSRTFTGRSP